MVKWTSTDRSMFLVHLAGASTALFDYLSANNHCLLGIAFALKFPSLDVLLEAARFHLQSGTPFSR
ncbi:hypothetical protein SAMN02745225_00559 [Ferrithrix thermotolerans DSM 19514]|uniref:Uncharacterized protein n=1 Tax=Ferrithrix thermotolerans DSM 19514 TaxID=1121881 RepID=A0A1M4TCJ2_9ACTN|nr:hypothetical protein SAMN02745225_00559 [Ferrithrix thermotolerans DSM 19514]